MRVRRVVGVVVAVVLTAGLSLGCQAEEPTPKMPKVTESKSPSPTESAEPERESAAAFVRRWQAAEDRMQVTGDTKEYVALSSDCVPCMDLVETVRGIYSRGGRVEFKGSQVLAVKRTGQTPPTFNLDLKVARTVVLDANGELESSYAAGRAFYAITLIRDKQSWKTIHMARR